MTTNVPGPQFPLYVAGRRMVYSYPYVPILGNVRISIAIFSYCGRLFFGITGDYDTVSDIDVLRDGIETGMQELVAAAGGASVPRRAGERGPKPEGASTPRRPRQAASAAPRSGKR